MGRVDGRGIMSKAVVSLKAIETSAQDELEHLVCRCTNDHAMCGTKVTAPILPFLTHINTCVVCRDLDRTGCLDCGI
jgi:hypothetical protein